MIYLDHLLNATHGVLLHAGKQSHFDAFSHDTRQLIPGELFVAVRGERSDGHDYLLDAVQRGASGLLVEAEYLNALAEEAKKILAGARVATIVVEDTRIALQQYARFILDRWHPTVIAVTGSTGKTSTKEVIAAVLSSNFATFKSWQNYNDVQVTWDGTRCTLPPPDRRGLSETKWSAYQYFVPSADLSARRPFTEPSADLSAPT